MNFQRSVAIVLVALFVCPTTAIAKAKACTGIPKKCTKDVLYDKTIGGTVYSCYDCKQALCNEGTNGEVLAGTKTESVCTEKATTFTPISDDDSSYDTAIEAAPEAYPDEQDGQVTINKTGGIRSELVIIQEQECSAGSVKLCSSNGASCGLVHGQSGKPSEVCRWPSVDSAEDCKRTAGIWTAANSRYANNNPDAVAPGSTGACITDVGNILKRLNHATVSTNVSAPRAGTKVPGLATPTRLRIPNVTDATLTVAWVDNSTTEYGVEVYRIDPAAARRENATTWELIGLAEERIMSNVEGTGSRTYEDYDLTPDTRYCYKLRAYTGFDRARTTGFSESVCGKTDP
jgi:hypothetical protein